MFCFTCGGSGFFDKDCPDCGIKKLEKEILLHSDDLRGNGEFVSKLKTTCIPPQYVGVYWDVDILKRENCDKLAETNGTGYNDFLFKNLIINMSVVNKVFASGNLPEHSIFVIAPSGYSKVTFAYSCMQRALKQGYTVAPLLDTVEAKRALVLASERVRDEVYPGFSYEDYIFSDVLFLTVSKMYSRKEAYSCIQEIMDRRSRKGLTTNVISRYSLEEISDFDKLRSFDSIKKDSFDTSKYPKIFQYFERRT